MYIREYKTDLLVPDEVYDKYGLKNVAFFDIETTGFNKVSDVIMLVSLGYYLDREKFYIKQYYAEYVEDEESIMQELKKDISGFNFWCSYNGIAFDEPYVKKKMEIHHIDFTAPENHIDLYRLIKPYYTQFGLQRCNLKTIEKYLGIERKDQIDGGLSAQLYKQYLYTNNEEIRDTIMLHNYEDVLNLPILFNLLHKIDTDPSIIKEPSITKNQLRYINILAKKNNITLKSNLSSISKKAASRAIDCILKGNHNGEEIDFLIKDTY
ncbi:ribonuclease H-like domain-containing protein [Hathewaya histolytica]|uniref:Elongation subunit of DNA-dependent DNA polymerase n=1 Tax=Hathewaya histolytica TaxID=1498 RepID=A0A4U9R8T3_HATHI|nr:ribonuclease H-like domain-containing protein [Hathewaya histolytica]VTQ86563.1 elongation subunit of DNA-dependent DNA polymerase [Hathewaya histolytica]